MLLGAAEDGERSQRIAERWKGPVVNLCGRLSPRLSAAAVCRAELLMCHDSGPMHLAAAVGTRCVAVFSNKDAPGRWYPFGRNHVVHRPSTPTSGMESIAPSVVAASVLRALEQRGQPQSVSGEVNLAAR
jgi:ADP-heptose:LPS heptosyltransferase